MGSESILSKVTQTQKQQQKTKHMLSILCGSYTQTGVSVGLEWHFKKETKPGS